MDEPFDRSWRKIGLALEKARIKATDMDRSKGIYFFAPVPDKDKKKLPDHQILVRENTSGSEVTVVDAEGKSNAETARMLDKLFQNLEK
jgi:outer membrane protein assembly factor BamC